MVSFQLRPLYCSPAAVVAVPPETVSFPFFFLKVARVKHLVYCVVLAFVLSEGLQMTLNLPE